MITHLKRACRSGPGVFIPLIGSALTIIFLVLVLGGCDKLPDPAGNLPEGGKKPANEAAFVVTTDYALTGGFGVIDLTDLSSYSPDPAWAAQVVSPDPAAVSSGDHIFVLNRLNYDTISVLDMNYELINQYSVTDSSCGTSNPHDIAVVSKDEAYVSMYECTDLWIINPLTGEKKGAIDLSSYADPDGIPEMSGMLLLGSTLYVAVQRLDRNAGYNWDPHETGLLVMIDTDTKSVSGEIELQGKNPVTDVLYSDSLQAIIIGSEGSHFDVGDEGGIEAVDPVSSASLGFLIDETGLGGNLGDFAILSAGRGYATITTNDLRSKLIAFNPTTGQRESQAIYTTNEGYAMWDMALSQKGQLLICDRNATDPGVLVFDVLDQDRLLTKDPIDLGLPPFSITLIE